MVLVCEGMSCDSSDVVFCVGGEVSGASCEMGGFCDDDDVMVMGVVCVVMVGCDVGIFDGVGIDVTSEVGDCECVLSGAGDCEVGNCMTCEVGDCVSCEVGDCVSCEVGDCVSCDVGEGSICECVSSSMEEDTVIVVISDDATCCLVWLLRLPSDVDSVNVSLEADKVSSVVIPLSSGGMGE